MTLQQIQSEFLRHAGLLIAKANDMGLSPTAGELYRTPEQQLLYLKAGKTKTPNSLHTQRLAIDLNFFVNGVLTYDKKVLAPLGAFWESLHPLNSWGGNGKTLVDTPHFSRGVDKPEWARVT